jgi:hypothetical protein
MHGRGQAVPEALPEGNDIRSPPLADLTPRTNV